MKDGGQAFPWGGGILGGMTLRDWFAGQALNGMVAADNDDQLARDAKAGHRQIKEHYAILAYEFADAMMEARTK